MLRWTVPSDVCGGGRGVPGQGVWIVQAGRVLLDDVAAADDADAADAAAAGGAVLQWQVLPRARLPRRELRA